MIHVREIEAKSILTKTRVPAGDYVINPYIGCPHKCMYCYADYMRRFTDHQEPWGDFIDIKHYTKKIPVKRLSGKKILFGSSTDPYHPLERKYRVTRGLLAQFAGTEIAVQILTKSDVVLDDIAILEKIPNCTVGFSLLTMDDTIRRALEPRAPSIERRLAAARKLHAAGISTYLFLSPLFPGITDFREILTACRDFTGTFYFENLNLRGAFRPAVLAYIREKHPSLVPLYDDIYRRKNMEYWRVMEKEIDAFCRQHKIIYGSYFYHEKIKKA